MSEIRYFYNKYICEPMETRLRLGAIAYKKLEEELRTVYSSWDAFNACIDLTIMFLCGDGDFTRKDYDIFIAVSKKSPTYDQAYDTARAVSKNYTNIINKYKTLNTSLRASIVYLASVIFACKGSFGRSEEIMVNPFNY